MRETDRGSGRGRVRMRGRVRLCWANHLAYRARGLLAQKNIHKELQHISADGDGDCDTDPPSSQTNDNQKIKKKRPQKIAASQNSSQTGEQVRQRERGKRSGRKTFGH